MDQSYIGPHVNLSEYHSSRYTSDQTLEPGATQPTLLRCLSANRAVETLPALLRHRFGTTSRETLSVLNVGRSLPVCTGIEEFFFLANNR